VPGRRCSTTRHHEHSVVSWTCGVCDPSLLMAKTMPPRWSDGYGAARVMPRGGTNADVRWIDIEPLGVPRPQRASPNRGTSTSRWPLPGLWRQSQDA